MGKLVKYRSYGRLLRVYGRSLIKYGSPRKIVNALRTEMAYRRRQSDVRSYPYILFLEPLYYCNLDCPLCDRQIFPDARENSAGKLSLELFDRLLAEAGKYLFQCQIFGQGEPLLDWARTKYIIEQCHERRIFTLMSTNCTLVTPQNAKEVVASGLDHLVCAIDGITQESYSKYRVKGQVAEALAGLKLFVEERRRQKSSMVIEWQFLVNRFNHTERTEAAEMARQLGVVIRFAPIRGMEFDRDLQQEWLAPEEEFRAADRQMGETIYDWPCYFLWRSLVLNSNGMVARCLIYQNVAEYGSLESRTVHDVYNDPSMQRARQLFQQSDVAEGEFPAPCGTCSFYKRHHGGPNQDKPQSLGRPSKNDKLVSLSVSAMK
jgi:MoaA/NifB/PqqE/SkfB family radical SAM enzyme